jgi:hypothetical protein
MQLFKDVMDLLTKDDSIAVFVLFLRSLPAKSTNINVLLLMVALSVDEGTVSSQSRCI